MKCRLHSLYTYKGLKKTVRIKVNEAPLALLSREQQFQKQEEGKICATLLGEITKGKRLVSHFRLRGVKLRL